MYIYIYIYMYIYCVDTFTIVREYIHTSTFFIYDIYCSDIREYPHTNPCTYIHIHQSIYNFVRVYMDTYVSEIHFVFLYTKLYMHIILVTHLMCPRISSGHISIHFVPICINFLTYIYRYTCMYMHMYICIYTYKSVCICT